MIDPDTQQAFAIVERMCKLLKCRPETVDAKLTRTLKRLDELERENEQLKRKLEEVK